VIDLKNNFYVAGASGGYANQELEIGGVNIGDLSDIKTAYRGLSYGDGTPGWLLPGIANYLGLQVPDNYLNIYFFSNDIYAEGGGFEFRLDRFDATDQFYEDFYGFSGISGASLGEIQNLRITGNGVDLTIHGFQDGDFGISLPEPIPGWESFGAPKGPLYYNGQTTAYLQSEVRLFEWIYRDTVLGGKYPSSIFDDKEAPTYVSSFASSVTSGFPDVASAFPDVGSTFPDTQSAFNSISSAFPEINTAFPQITTGGVSVSDAYPDFLSAVSTFNIFTGSEGVDVINGGQGNDTIRTGDGSDTISGGSGLDLLSYSRSGSGVQVSLETGSTRMANGDTDRFKEIEHIEGSSFNDLIVADASGATLSGGDGNDYIISGGRSDLLTGGRGHDIFSFGPDSGSDRIVDFSVGEDLIEINIPAISYADLIFEKGGYSTTVSYIGGATGSIMLLGVDQSALSASDFRFTPTSQASNLTVAAGNNTFFATAGAEEVDGSVGNDTVLGLGGDDTLDGGSGDDVLDGGFGEDKLTGGVGADIFTFSSLADSVDDNGANNNRYDRITDFEIGTDKIDLRGLGFFGFDTDGGSTEAGELRLSYSANSNRTYVKTDQSSFEFYLDGDFSQSLTAAEVLFDAGLFVSGDDTAQSLQGALGDDTILGFVGDDTITGSDGDDVLNGGADEDKLTGGNGSDIFAFSSLTDSVDDNGVNDNRYDRITDFEVGIDKIDLRGLGFIGFDSDGGSTEAGELRLFYSSNSNRTYVRTDQSSFEFYLDGDYTSTLSTGDFLLDPGFQLSGTLSAESLAGGVGDDFINALEGDDTIAGGDGDDVIDGGAGEDKLTGGNGADTFTFSSLTHSIDDNGANDNRYDRITDFQVGIDKIDLRGLGFTGLDDDGGTTEASELRLYYSSSSDRTYVRTDQSSFEFYLDGSYTATLSSSDFLFDQGVLVSGTANAELLVGDIGDDTILGLGGHDTLDGASGNDILIARNGNAVLDGGTGDDTALGMEGDDTIDGGVGADHINGGAGEDKLTGGSGADVFAFTSLTDSVDDNGANDNRYDRITDFEIGIDLIDVSGIGFIGFDTDGGNTESGELRMTYSSNSDRTYVKSDQSDFVFYLDGNFTSTLSESDFNLA